jgi:hypothetical protein
MSKFADLHLGRTLTAAALTFVFSTMLVAGAVAPFTAAYAPHLTVVA